jgi:hypothetical protein
MRKWVEAVGLFGTELTVIAFEKLVRRFLRMGFCTAEELVANFVKWNFETLISGCWFVANSPWAL